MDVKWELCVREVPEITLFLLFFHLTFSRINNCRGYRLTHKTKWHHNLLIQKAQFIAVKCHKELEIEQFLRRHCQYVREKVSLMLSVCLRSSPHFGYSSEPLCSIPKQLCWPFPPLLRLPPASAGCPAMLLRVQQELCCPCPLVPVVVLSMSARQRPHMGSAGGAASRAAAGSMQQAAHPWAPLQQSI